MLRAIAGCIGSSADEGQSVLRPQSALASAACSCQESVAAWLIPAFLPSSLCMPCRRPKIWCCVLSSARLWPHSWASTCTCPLPVTRLRVGTSSRQQPSKQGPPAPLLHLAQASLPPQSAPMYPLRQRQQPRSHGACQRAPSRLFQLSRSLGLLLPLRRQHPRSCCRSAAPPCPPVSSSLRPAAAPKARGKLQLHQLLACRREVSLLHRQALQGRHRGPQADLLPSCQPMRGRETLAQLCWTRRCGGWSQTSWLQAPPPPLWPTRCSRGTRWDCTIKLDATPACQHVDAAAVLELLPALTVATLLRGGSDGCVT